MTVISSRRNPFELFLLAACLLSGVSGVIDPYRGSQAVVDALPLWELYVWYSGLAIGSLIALLGALRRRMLDLYIERMGLSLLTGLTLGYAVALVSQANRPLALPVVVTISFCVACYVRLRQINSELRAAKLR
jgi:hypothetical protein